jgi:hypothetical protein
MTTRAGGAQSYSPSRARRSIDAGFAQTEDWLPESSGFSARAQLVRNPSGHGLEDHARLHVDVDDQLLRTRLPRRTSEIVPRVDLNSDFGRFANPFRQVREPDPLLLARFCAASWSHGHFISADAALRVSSTSERDAYHRQIAPSIDVAAADANE